MKCFQSTSLISNLASQKVIKIPPKSYIVDFKRITEIKKEIIDARKKLSKSNVSSV